MVVSVDVNKLAEHLERQELEAPSGVTTPQVYAQLLAVYLHQNDLCNAKYLWKRIPPNVKSSHAELGHVWTVGQHLWQRDFPSAYKALSETKWSDSVADIMKGVEENVRKRTTNLIAQAYSSISLDTVAQMTGLTAEQAVAAAVEKGWHVEPDTHIVHPKPPSDSPVTHISSENQLYKLTEFVSFLEN